MYRLLAFVMIFSLSLSAMAQLSDETTDIFIFTVLGDSIAEEPLLVKEEVVEINWGITTVTFDDDTVYRRFIIDSRLVSEGWDTLSQPSFWQRVMVLSEDSAFINIAENRQILETILARDYLRLSQEKKDEYKREILSKYDLPSSTRIFVTTGKQHFYKFRNTFNNINQSICVFLENGVDPWYAQTILLIESPDKLQKSTAGAYGPFQLMRSVAKKYGLTVNNLVDERECVELSAMAASKLLKYVCIPEAKRLLRRYNLTYCEDQLWFRLLVLHVYYAGSGNVGAVLDAIQPLEGGSGLIASMWRTSAKGFKNASQNYSQVALAAIMELHRIVYHECIDISY